MSEWPSMEAIERERRRLSRRRRRGRVLAALLGTIAALAVARSARFTRRARFRLPA